MDWSLSWKFKFAYLKLYSLILNLEDLLKDGAQNAQPFFTKRASERLSLIQIILRQDHAKPRSNY